MSDPFRGLRVVASTARQPHSVTVHVSHFSVEVEVEPQFFVVYGREPSGFPFVEKQRIRETVKLILSVPRPMYRLCDDRN